MLNAAIESGSVASDGQASRREYIRRLIGGLSLSLISGLLAVLSFEDYGIGGLIWFAFVPAIVAQHRILPPRVSGLALAIAVGVMFQGYMGPGLFSSELAWYFYVYGLWVGLVVLLLTWRSRRFHSRTGYRWFVLTTPVAWVAIDFIRTTQTEVFGGTWGMVAYALYEQPEILQPVSVFGIHGMNLVILLVNWTIALAVLVALDQRFGSVDGRRQFDWPVTRIQISAAAVTVAAWIVASLLMLDSPEAELRVAAIQPGKFVADGWRKVSVITAEEEIKRSIEQTRTAAAEGAKLVVWREVGVTFDLTGEKGQVFRDLADELDIHLVIGWQAPTGDSKGWDAETQAYRGDRFNESAAFGPDGALLGSYGKSHPGEFAGDFSARRDDYQIYPARWGSYSTIICFDLDFTDSARRSAELGANIMAVPSSDVPGIAHKHYTHLVFRAIETRLPMVKADSAFDSAIVDPFGRIVSSAVSKAGAQATVVGDVPLGSGTTFYVRFGEWFGWLAVVVTAVFFAVEIRTRWAQR